MRRATAQSTPTAASAAWVGVEQQTAATSSSSVRSTSWPTALITGTGVSATVRHSVSSQKAQRSAMLPPPRMTTMASTSANAARSRTAPAIAGAARRSCTGAYAQTIVPRHARRSSPARKSRRAALPSAVTTPMRRGSTGRGRSFCGSKSPSASAYLPC